MGKVKGFPCTIQKYHIYLPRSTTPASAPAPGYIWLSSVIYRASICLIGWPLCLNNLIPEWTGQVYPIGQKLISHNVNSHSDSLDVLVLSSSCIIGYNFVQTFPTMGLSVIKRIKSLEYKWKCTKLLLKRDVHFNCVSLELKFILLSELLLNLL